MDGEIWKVTRPDRFGWTVLPGEDGVPEIAEATPLEKLRSGEPLTAKEKPIHDQGLVTVLRQIHDELDEAVLEVDRE